MTFIEAVNTLIKCHTSYDDFYGVRVMNGETLMISDEDYKEAWRVIRREFNYEVDHRTGDPE